MDNEKEITIDEAVNDAGDVAGMITINKRKLKYFVEGQCVRVFPQILDVLKKAVKQFDDEENP